jgi:hypothetical protein
MLRSLLRGPALRAPVLCLHPRPVTRPPPPTPRRAQPHTRLRALLQPHQRCLLTFNAAALLVVAASASSADDDDDLSQWRVRASLHSRRARVWTIHAALC